MYVGSWCWAYTRTRTKKTGQLRKKQGFGHLAPPWARLRPAPHLHLAPPARGGPLGLRAWDRGPTQRMCSLRQLLPLAGVIAVGHDVLQRALVSSARYPHWAFLLVRHSQMAVYIPEESIR